MKGYKIVFDASLLTIETIKVCILSIESTPGGVKNLVNNGH